MPRNPHHINTVGKHALTAIRLAELLSKNFWRKPGGIPAAIPPILTFKDTDDAIALSHSTPYGLSSDGVPNNMEYTLGLVKELKAGTVNINEVPGHRIESAPFGGE